MVSSYSMAAMIVTLLLSSILPIILFILIRRSSKNVTGAVIAGALAFFLAQIVVRMQLLQLLPGLDWYKTLTQNAIFFILFLAVTAALFEETARYFVFQTVLKEKQVWKCGIAYGIGHGGIESLILIGLTYINNIVLSIMINTNSFHSLLGIKLPKDTVSHIYKSLVNTSSGLFLAAGVERVMTICIQIALSVLVLEGIVQKKRLKFYILAIIGHTAVNFLSAYLFYQKLNYWIVEIVVVLFAGAGLFYILTSRRRFGDKIEAEDEAVKVSEEGY